MSSRPAVENLVTPPRLLAPAAPAIFARCTASPRSCPWSSLWSCRPGHRGGDPAVALVPPAEAAVEAAAEVVLDDGEAGAGGAVDADPAGPERLRGEVEAVDVGRAPVRAEAA